MITIPDGDWYYGSSSQTLGPFRTDGTWAYNELPPIRNSAFKQGSSFAGQSSVSHVKEEYSITVDPWRNPLDRRMSDIFPVGHRAGRTNQWDIVILDSRGYQTYKTAFNKGMPGSFSHSGKVAHAFKLSGSGNIVREINYVAIATSGEAWIHGFEYHVGPLTIAADGRSAYADVSMWQIGPLTHHEVVFTPGHEVISGQALLSSKPGHSRSFLGKNSAVFYRRPDRHSVQLDTHLIQDVSSSLIDNTPLPELSLRSYGELSQQATGKLKKVDSNLLEAIVELKSLKGLTKQLLALPKTIGLRKSSGDYLAVKWAALPIVNDLLQIIGSFSKMGPTLNSLGIIQLTGTDKSSATLQLGDRSVSTIVTRRAHLYVYPDQKMETLSRFLRDHGLFPTAKNLWDIIPFSFLLDWFVNVGKFLHTLDANQEFAELSIPVCVYSEKRENTYNLQIEGIGMVTVVRTTYNRFWTKSPIAPVYSFRDNQVTAHKRWLEGSALILQIKRK